MDAEARDGTAVRLDIWLWAARFFRTRSLAKQAIEKGQVQVNGQRPKASRIVRVGDALHLERAGELYDVAVLGISDDRGPATVAQALYAETDASKQRREEERAVRRATATGYRAPEGKPNKRARRLIRALGDLDAL